MKIAIKLINEEIERKTIFLKAENDIVYMRELQKDIDVLTDAVKKLTIPVVVKQSKQLICADCNGEGGFQFSIDPDDCKLCDTCKGSGAT